MISAGRLYFLQSRSAMEKDKWVGNINKLVDAVDKDVVDFKDETIFKS
jgi:hypothetical protein